MDLYFYFDTKIAIVDSFSRHFSVLFFINSDPHQKIFYLEQVEGHNVQILD